MRITIIALAVLAMGLTVAQAPADDYLFPNHTDDPMYWWYLQDYPRWHYEGDAAFRYGSAEPYEYLIYVQLELSLLENTLVEQNVIHMLFVVITTYDDFEFYFDINPGETYIEEQFPIGIYSDGEGYVMEEQNTIPDGEGWVVIDEDNSWVDRFTNTAVEPESLGKIKTLFE